MKHTYQWLCLLLCCGWVDAQAPQIQPMPAAMQETIRAEAKAFAGVDCQNFSTLALPMGKPSEPSNPKQDVTDFSAGFMNSILPSLDELRLVKFFQPNPGFKLVAYSALGASYFHADLAIQDGQGVGNIYQCGALK